MLFIFRNTGGAIAEVVIVCVILDTGKLFPTGCILVIALGLGLVNTCICISHDT